MNISDQAPYGSGERFDLEDFINPAVLMAVTGQRFDAADTALFLRQLTDVYTQTYDVKYPDLKARTLIPVDSRINPGAESFVWRQFDRRGAAKIVHNFADDFPNVELKGKEFQTRIVSAGVSYQYTMQDLRAASMAGLPLESRKAETARRVMEELIEKVACTGMTLTNDPVNASDSIPIYGLANFPNILAGGAGGYTALNWLAAGTTVAQILADLNALQKTIFDTSLGVHTGDTLVLPTALYSFLATTPRSPTFTEDSMLQYILRQSPWLKSIEYWAPLDTAGKKQDTTTTGPRILLYQKSPENMQLVIPQEFEQLPPQLVKMSFIIPCHMRIAGVTVRYPKSVAYLDGATG